MRIAQRDINCRTKEYTEAVVNRQSMPGMGEATKFQLPCTSLNTIRDSGCIDAIVKFFTPSRQQLPKRSDKL